MKYNVSIEIRGKLVPVGSISDDTGPAVFRYGKDYLSRPDAAAISFSLPLRESPFSSEETRYFFESLLPEGFTRRTVAGYLRLDENDYIGILYALGEECLGALRVFRDGDESKPAYELLDPRRIRQIASEGVSESAVIVAESHLSLAGASGKVGLYYDGQNDLWYLPHGTAPSTHIVKQSHIRYKKIIQNEQLCLRTAALCGLDVAKSTVISTGEGHDEDLLLASCRYDRVFPEYPDMISGLPAPRRLHQEDFAQALGIPAQNKYEHGQHYLRDMFELLRTRSADPIKDQTELWNRIVFNYLIGNTDAHIKNFSLLYSDDLSSVRLAPAYDMIHTGYSGISRNMAFAIGGIYEVDKITTDSFRVAAREAGLGEQMAMLLFDSMTDRFPDALNKATEELEIEGIAGVREWKEILLKK